MNVRKCIIPYFKTHVLSLILIIIIIIAVTLISLIPPLLLKEIIDEGILKGNTNLLFRFALFYLGVYLLIGITNFLKETVLVVLSQGITKEIRNKMMLHLESMEYHKFVQLDSGELESYFSNDVDQINNLITNGAISMVIDLFKIIGIIISIFIFNIYLGYITLAILPIILVIAFVFRKLMFQAQIKNRNIEGNVNNMVLETLDNNQTIKSFRVYEYFYNKYRLTLEKHYRTTEHANFYDSIFAPLMQIIKSIVIALIILLSASDFTIFAISTGILVSYIDLVTNLFTPIETVGMELQTIQKSLAGMKRINQFFSFEKIDQFNRTNLSTNTINKFPILEFKNVYYSYNGINYVIENFSLQLSKNDHLTIQGASGTGKSTLFKLAYGILKPNKGSVTLNGIDCYLLDDESRRKYFGILFQDTFFCNGTVYEELTLENKDVPEEEVRKAIKLVGLDQQIKDLNAPFSLSVFSKGEEVLFNLARLLISNPPIWFLDEMNAKIDPNTALNLIKMIHDLGKDKMIISINHYGENLEDSKIIRLKQ